MRPSPHLSVHRTPLWTRKPWQTLAQASPFKSTPTTRNGQRATGNGQRASTTSLGIAVYTASAASVGLSALQCQTPASTSCLDAPQCRERWFDTSTRGRSVRAPGLNSASFSSTVVGSIFSGKPFFTPCAARALGSAVRVLHTCPICSIHGCRSSRTRWCVSVRRRHPFACAAKCERQARAY